jgi:hypothetical protein
VSHGERQGDAARLQRQPLAVAEIVAALPDVEVAVADPGGADAQAHLRAFRLRRLALGELKRRSEFCDLIAFHGRVPRQALSETLARFSAQRARL